MRYDVGDEVALSRDITLNTGATLEEGTEGEVTEVKEMLQQYVVDFAEESGVWVGDSDVV